MTAYRRWEADPNRAVDWDWSDSGFSFRHPKRFELALWQNGKLVALSLGRPTYRGTCMRLDFIEKTVVDSKINVTPYTMIALETYANLVGAKELRLMNPVNDGVKRYCESIGFTYVSKDDYLVQPLIG